jgi:periplasmic protein TonB
MRLIYTVLALTLLLSAQEHVSGLSHLSGPIRMAEAFSKNNIVKRIDPQYPAAARASCIQGDVVLLIITATNGSVKSAKAISGPRELQSAAIEAVEKWQYAPYLLNGKPMELETRATVEFRLPPRQCSPKTT